MTFQEMIRRTVASSVLESVGIQDAGARKRERRGYGRGIKLISTQVVNAIRHGNCTF
jgi:hypothetical protein